MDRYVIREPRGEYPQGNQMIPFSPNTGSNNMVPPEGIYYSGYGAEFPMHGVGSAGFMGVTHVNSPAQPQFRSNLNPGHGQVVSGMDTRYLAAYADNNAAFISDQQRQQMRGEQNQILDNTTTFAENYQKHNFAGAERNNSRKFAQPVSGDQQRQQMRGEQNQILGNITTFAENNQNHNFAGAQRNNSRMFTQQVSGDQQRQQIRGDQNQILGDTTTFAENYQNHNFPGAQRNNSRMFTQQVSGVSTPRNETLTKANNMPENFNAQVQKKAALAPPPTHTPPPLLQPKITNVPPNQAVAEVTILKSELENPSKMRFDKLKALYKGGPRVFSGPVENILKWHKALQDIGVLVLYEIVAKCVNVRPGETCAKNLVVRDDNGPAIQVVYYEIDFLLTDLKPPCTVRVIGRMMPGTCRLHAFNIRPATGDDVSTLPRRAAIAAHHVAKLCKEYGTNV